MVLNTLGYQIINDFGVPKTFTGICETAVSGGEFVYCGSKTQPVTSGASSFVTSDILIGAPASGTQYVVGMATHNAGSNSYVTVLTEGIVIVTSAAAVTPGNSLYVANNDAVSQVAAGSITDVILNQLVGKALTSCGSEGCCVLKLRV